MNSDDQQAHPVTTDADPATCRHLDVVETVYEDRDERKTTCRSCGDEWVEVLEVEESDPREEASYWRETWDEAG